MSYDAVSHLATRSDATLSTLGRRYETPCRRIAIHRARALALEMRARAGSDAEYARAVLEWFRTRGLEYTLEPGTTSIDSVDDTLFETRRGFCGHFASAYATLMRAAGVPARVVTGYLGGEWNPVGSYLIVRQSEALAWTEIWLQGQGWTRVDPTAVVAPERLQRGVFEMLANSAQISGYLRNNAWLNRFRARLGWRAAVVAGARGGIRPAFAVRPVAEVSIDYTRNGSTWAGLSRWGWSPGSRGWLCRCVAAWRATNRPHRACLVTRQPQTSARRWRHALP